MRKTSIFGLIFSMIIIFSGVLFSSQSIYIHKKNGLSQYEAQFLIPKHSATSLIWNYTTGDDIDSVAISSDGQYIVAGSKDNNTYLSNYNVISIR